MRYDLNHCLKEINELIRRERFEEALKIADEGLRRFPDSFPLLLNKGVLHLALGEIEKSIEALWRAADVNPESLEVWFDLGAAYMANGDFDWSAMMYFRAVSLDPTNVRYLDNLLKLLILSGDEEDALKVAEKLYELVPDDKALVRTLGSLYYNAGRPGKALRMYEKFLNIEQSPEAHFLVSLARNTLGHWKKALEHAEMGLKAEPMNHFGWYVKAEALYIGGLLKDSLDAVERAIKLNPREPEYIALRGSILFELGERMRALEDAEKVLKLTGDRLDMLEIKYRVLKDMGKREELDDIKKRIDKLYMKFSV